MGVTDIKETLTDFKDAHKRTALHFAARKGRRKVVTYILDRAPEYDIACFLCGVVSSRGLMCTPGGF